MVLLRPLLLALDPRLSAWVLAVSPLTLKLTVLSVANEDCFARGGGGAVLLATELHNFERRWQSMRSTQQQYRNEDETGRARTHCEPVSL